MTRVLLAQPESFPIAGSFTISRGSKTEAEVICCTIVENGTAGRGECVPYRRYGETIASVLAAIEERRADIERGITREELIEAMPAGAARNALDCALWDLEAKRSGRTVAQMLAIARPEPITTAFTLSLDTPEKMAAQARANSDRPLLKVKIGGQGDVERVQAVVEAAPRSRIILDANEGWTEADLAENLEMAARLGVSLVEQPLAAGQDEALRGISRPVSVCADESVHTADHLERLVGLYDAVNIKLDKAGGLTAALQLKTRARELGFGIMVGCMVGTSLGMAPAVLLAQDADFVDLDGPLLLARDREPGLIYAGSLVSPPSSDLWG
ncbi:dipeptide epimerase [Pseudaminobacter sp. 19-2017]|uniref:Dipeptide epimerase n=1 Tax=Pseudaminobacter soli (ex Zhang et al. 2022) TaxID=2831468 RepID=A0A942DXC0_9HYPH|nr:N-acetyl-D-Glu racemase DgcA [Pseudaminobacter soli]MBS3647063.1 dipeptide epimerase [Pseudaminobacter soli]